MKRSLNTKIISIFVAILMAVTAITPTMSAMAGDGVEGFYDLEIFYKDTGTIVPTYGEDGESDYIEYMYEGDTLQLKYELIDSEWPDNGYVKWYSEDPKLVDVDQNGKVKAFDSSKGAVVQAWIDNEVKTIPLIGSALGSALEKVFFNEYVNLDSMDTEEICNIVIDLFGSESWLQDYIEAYEGKLVDSLRDYLNNINSDIHCQLYDSKGTLCDDDEVHICVKKSEEWYSAFLPNGTHITNKAQINTTQAVGSTVQLSAITTPQRLGFGTVYSVKSSSIFTNGKVVATVNDSGLVTFKNTGTVTILVSPDSDDVIQSILKLVNYVHALDNTGTLDTDKIAGILIDYMGVDMNRTVLAGLLDACFAIYEVVGDTADPVQLTATAVKIIANIILQMAYNDSITFTVEKAQPITSFDIEGPASVKEGSQIQMAITNVQPSTGDTSDITWKSSNPEIASVDPKTGIITGRDAGGSLGQLSSQKCTITATSAANKIEKSVSLVVTGKTGKYLSDVVISGKDTLSAGESVDYTYQVYPKRVAELDNLYIKWGMKTGEDEDGNPVYSWADEENSVTDKIGKIDYKGHYDAVGGGSCTIALQATTGYYLSNGKFYEISSFTKTLEISNGIPVKSVKVTAIDGTSNGDLNRTKTVTIEGVNYDYATIKKGVAEAYVNNGAVLKAEITPADATNQEVKWVVDGDDYSKTVEDNTHKCSVKMKAGHEYADTFNVHAVTPDGKVVSNTVTICITKNYVKSNKIDQSSITFTNGKTTNATHSVTYDSSTLTTSYYKCPKANWYSSDESVFTIKSVNDSGNAVLESHDVGVAKVYCVSADGAYVDSCEVKVLPDKTYLQEIVDLCDNTVVLRTDYNKDEYKKYMRKLDMAYSVLYDREMASQDTCITYANELLLAFYKLGGFVGINSVDILGKNQTKLDSDYVTVKVGTLSSYKNYSYDFDYIINPKDAMYKSIDWTSSDSSVSVDKSGKCKPTSNDPSCAKITCTVTDYMGNKASDSVYVAFARTKVTGVKLDTTVITGGKVGETKELKATVSPTNVLGNTSASNDDLIWKSSDTSVATVDSKGKITYVYGGDCVVTCTTVDGGFTATCAVNVVTNYQPLQLLINQYTDLKLNSVNYYPDTWDDFVAKKAQAQAMINKGGYTQKEVDAMYASLVDSYNSLKKYNNIQKIELYLDGEATSEFYQYNLSLLKEGVSYKNAVLDLNIRLYPNNGSYKSVQWSSSTSDISVTNEGKCSPTIQKSCYGSISCVVTDHFGNEFTDSVWVSFAYSPVTALVLSDENITGNVGDTYQMACSVEPTGTSLVHLGKASIQDYYWESDDEKIATVDEDGVVTFVSAGSTKIRAVSYDGGVSAECTVSTDGDRSALKAALDKYKDIDCTNYDYEYAQTFKKVYKQAEDALTNLTLTQDGIDEATNNLIASGEAMIAHPYVKVEDIDVTYKTYKKPLIGSTSQVSSGTVGNSNALSIDLSSNYTNWNDYNHVTLGATALPSKAMYKTIVWSTVDKHNMDVDISGATVTATPTKQSDGGWAKLSVTTTDNYDRQFKKEIWVVMSDKIANGLSVTTKDYTAYATDNAKAISYKLSGKDTPEFTNIVWSTSNSKVATVDQSGNVKPVDKGTATITAKSFDGGYKGTVKVTVLTNFTILADKVAQYQNVIDNVKETYEYTEESLSNLTQAVTKAREMIDEGKATQAEVNKELSSLNDAYGKLEKYVVATGVAIAVEDGQKEVTTPNAGYIQYKNTSLTGKTVQLLSGLQPSNSKYTSMLWESSNKDITVDEFGLVTNKSALACWSTITCTITNVNNQTFKSSVVLSFVRYGVTAVEFEDATVFGAPQQTKTVTPKLTCSTQLPTSMVKDCSYTSSNPDVATVDQDGKVTFLTQGNSTITCTTRDGGYTATIQAYTTWDTTALSAAIDQASAITYTDYAYDYGMPFKNAYDKAVEVYNNVYALQDEIDSACYNLQTAMTNLGDNKFTEPTLELKANGSELVDGRSYQVDGNSQVKINYQLNAGAVAKSVKITATNTAGVQTQTDGNSFVITKKSTTGMLTVVVTVVDEYDREVTKEYKISVVNKIVNITAINLTVDGKDEGDSYTKSGCGYTYSGYKDIQLAYVVASPTGATPATSVKWSSSNTAVTVSDEGVVGITTSAKLHSSNTSVITCTVTNSDGSTVSKNISITIAR